MASGALFVLVRRGWRPDAEGATRNAFHLGAPAAAEFLVGSMFFMSVLFSVNIGVRVDVNNQQFSFAISFCE